MSTTRSFSTETSERYARALFEVVKEKGDLEKNETDINNFQTETLSHSALRKI